MVLIVAIIAWELWPKAMSVHTFRYDEGNSPNLFGVCVRTSGILSATWELAYPRQVELNSESIITLRVIPPVTEEGEVLEECSQISIAAYLEIPGAVLEPGEIIFTAFERQQSTQITWRVLENSQKINGKLWVYAFPGEDRDLDTQIPLFAIPFKIELLSLFGLKPQFVRTIGLIGLLLVLVFYAFIYQDRSK